MCEENQSSTQLLLDNSFAQMCCIGPSCLRFFSTVLHEEPKEPAGRVAVPRVPSSSWSHAHRVYKHRYVRWSYLSVLCRGRGVGGGSERLLRNCPVCYDLQGCMRLWPISPLGCTPGPNTRRSWASSRMSSVRRASVTSWRYRRYDSGSDFSICVKPHRTKEFIFISKTILTKILRVDMRW